LGELTVIGETSTKFLFGPPRFLLYSRIAEKNENLSAAFEYVLLVQRNLLEYT